MGEPTQEELENKRKIQQLEVELAQLRKANARSEQENAALKGEVTKRDVRIQDQDGTIQALTNEKNQLGARFAQAKQENEDLTQQNQHLLGENEALGNLWHNAQKRIAGLEQRDQALQHQNKGLRDFGAQELTTPAEARRALHEVERGSKEVGGRAPAEAKRLAAEFKALQNDEKAFRKQEGQVLKDEKKLEKDRLHDPKRVAADQENLSKAEKQLQQIEAQGQRAARSLEKDATAFERANPEMAWATHTLVVEARRESGILHRPVVPDTPSHHGQAPHPQGHAQQVMDMLRKEAGQHSPTRKIVTKASRQVEVFEQSCQDLAARKNGYAEDLLRAQKDAIHNPKDIKRMLEDRNKLAQDQAEINTEKQLVGKEAQAIGRLAQEMGKEDPSLRKTARQLNQDVQAEYREAQQYSPSVPRDRSGGRER